MMLLLKIIFLFLITILLSPLHAQENKNNDSLRNMLIITCHPDDWELSMAGTAYLLKDKFNIHVIIASNGDRGNSKEPDPKIAALRVEHANKSAEKINAQKSIGAIAVILSLKKQLSKEGYYWFNLPKSAGFPFLALVEHTNYVSSDNFNGEHLIYCGDYLDHSHKYFKMNNEELIDDFLPSLKKINPSFTRDWIKKSWVFRTKYAQPIPRINHSRNLLQLRTPLSGLFLASMSQVYPWDRGTNYAVSLAHQVVQEMIASKSHS